MNTSIIRYIVGYILKIEAALLLIPSVVAAIYREPEGLCYLSVSALCIFLGVLLSFRKPKNHVFYLKEGCVATSLSWIVLSFFGSIPFLLTGEITSVPDALFETISGFTTTGASVLNNVEALSHCSLFWRSFTHWVGGMGVLVFLLAVAGEAHSPGHTAIEGFEGIPHIGEGRRNILPWNLPLKHAVQLGNLILFGVHAIPLAEHIADRIGFVAVRFPGIAVHALGKLHVGNLQRNTAEDVRRVHPFLDQDGVLLCRKHGPTALWQFLHGPDGHRGTGNQAL